MFSSQFFFLSFMIIIGQIIKITNSDVKRFCFVFIRKCLLFERKTLFLDKLLKFNCFYIVELKNCKSISSLYFVGLFVKPHGNKVSNLLPKDLFYCVIKNENLNVNTENNFFIQFPKEKKTISKVKCLFIYPEAHTFNFCVHLS